MAELADAADLKLLRLPFRIYSFHCSYNTLRDFVVLFCKCLQALADACRAENGQSEGVRR